MSTESATPAATPSAVISAPVVPSPQVSPQPAPGIGTGRRKVTAPVPAASTATKTYATASPKPFVVDVPKPVADVEAAPVIAEAPVTEAAAEDLQVLPEAEAKADDAAPEPPKEDNPEITNAEFAKRMGQIARAREKLDDEKRQFSQEREKHKASLERVQMMDNAKEHLHRDAIGFLHRVFDVKPEMLVDQLIAHSHLNGGKPQNTQQPATPADTRIAELEKKLEESLNETKQQQTKREEREYIGSAITPIVSDKSKYPFLNDEFGGQASEHVYRTMQANWDRGNKKAADPQVVADFIEKHFRDKAARAAALLGGGAPSPQTATPKKVAAPQAAPKPAAAQETPSVMRRPRLTGKSYTATVK